ncbi:hypothetical protein QJ854_gp202 [Moumouvirus goulette]|uniref:Uncharacterized protein n=1 Tax=Moumouvirus goulette TaxID=1247379 RepID=M1NNE6_9VIRU|nr:hypothetical protein QJ854_gp202 [Moumouvirus goulette]AGF85580.1 hypothetical protein glt_00775 [Moumouvirus goulette]
MSLNEYLKTPIGIFKIKTTDNILVGTKFLDSNKKKFLVIQNVLQNIINMQKNFSLVNMSKT